MATRPLLKESLQILDLCGLKPGHQNTSRTVLLVVLQATIYIYSFLEIAFQFVYNFDDLDSMDGISEMGMIYQVLFRILVTLVHGQDLVGLLSRIGQFWPLDKYGVQVKLEILSLMATLKKNIKIFLALFGICVSLYLLKPFVTAEKTLPFLTYHPRDRNQSPQYELMYCLNAGVMLWGSCAILPFDALFISCILYIVAELKMIKRGFMTMRLTEQDEKCCLREVKVLVDHHNLVLECIKDLDKVYSLMLLNQFLSSLVCICTGLLSLTGDGFPPDLQHFVKYVTFIMTILSQLFIYCAAGSYLIAESESVAEAVYESDWWAKTQPEVRRAYVLVIQRANKTEKLTAGGMFTLDLESFTRVVRTSLSFFTLVQALYTRSEQTRL